METKYKIMTGLIMMVVMVFSFIGITSLYDKDTTNGIIYTDEDTFIVMEAPFIEKIVEKEWKSVIDNVKIKETELCKTVFYNMTSWKNVNCTNVTYYYDCKENESKECKPYNWTVVECDNLKIITEHNSTKCLQISFDINLTSKKYDMNFEDFGNCSYHVDAKDNTKVKIICDSYYDSNLDGICQSGESCCVYYCDKDGCDFDEKNCKLNQYIKTIQRKKGLNKLLITDKVVIK